MPNPSDPQSLNRYSYVLNNPLKYIDPSGHRTCGPGANPLDETCDENMDNPGYGDDGPNASISSATCQDPWCTPIWHTLPVVHPSHIQWYGNTQWAFDNGAAHNYPNFAQSLHPGIDFGAANGTTVFAGTWGTVICTHCGAYGPVRVDIRYSQMIVSSGRIVNVQMRLLYGHLENIQVTAGQYVTPDTIIGDVGASHIHLEIMLVDSNGTYMTNPLPYFASDLQVDLLDIATAQIQTDNANLRNMVTFYIPPSGTLKWQNPYDQPDLRRQAGNIFPQ